MIKRQIYVIYNIHKYKTKKVANIQKNITKVKTTAPEQMEYA